MTLDIIATLSSSAIGLLAAFFSKAAEGFADAAGETAWDAASKVAALITAKMQPTPGGNELIEKLQQSPDDSKTQAELQSELALCLQADPQFKTLLESSVQQAKNAGAGAYFHTIIQGNVGKVVHVQNARDLKF